MAVEKAVLWELLIHGQQLEKHVAETIAGGDGGELVSVEVAHAVIRKGSASWISSVIVGGIETMILIRP
jgi:hypothetical protein